MVRARVAASLAVVVLAAAAVAAAVQKDRSPWPVGLDLPAVEADGTRTFSIDPGDRWTFPAVVARTGDVIVCEGRGSVTVGPPGAEVGDPAGLHALVDRDGIVRASCGSAT